MVEVDAAGDRLLVSVLCLDAAAVLKVAAVTQLLCRVPEAMVVSVKEEVPAVRPPPGWPVEHAAAGTPGHVQRATGVGEWVAAGGRHLRCGGGGSYG